MSGFRCISEEMTPEETRMNQRAILGYDKPERKQPRPQKTLRDEFAMAILPGMMANADWGCMDEEAYAKAAYAMADAMLKAREAHE